MTWASKMPQLASGKMSHNVSPCHIIWKSIDIYLYLYRFPCHAQPSPRGYTNTPADDWSSSADRLRCCVAPAAIRLLRLHGWRWIVIRALRSWVEKIIAYVFFCVLFSFYKIFIDFRLYTDDRRWRPIHQTRWSRCPELSVSGWKWIRQWSCPGYILRDNVVIDLHQHYLQRPNDYRLPKYRLNSTLTMFLYCCWLARSVRRLSP